MAVGKSSLERAGKGLAARKTIDEKAVLDNIICEAEIAALDFKAVGVNPALKSSIERFGLICPVVTVKKGDKLVVIDGNKRIAALNAMGVKTVKAAVLSGDPSTLENELQSFVAVTYQPLQPTFTEKCEKCEKGEKAENCKVKPNKSKMIEVKPEDDIHELKFKVISGLVGDLPNYLL